MYSDKVKKPEKPNRHKVRPGDVIVRSEYNDGVLRDNGRVNNRLSGQMKLFEKAERIILKDLKTEARLIRSRMDPMVSASPRLANYSSPNKHIGSYSVNGKSVYTTQSKQNDSTRGRGKAAVLQSFSNKSMYTLGQESLKKTGRERQTVTKKNILDRDNERHNSTYPISSRTVDSVVTVTPRNDPVSDSDKNPLTLRKDRKHDTTLSESQITNRTTFRKGGIQSSVGDRHISSSSRISLQDLLEKAAEARSKGLTIEEHVPRPRTPELLSGYGSDDSEMDQKRKLNHVGSTPKSTLLSQYT